MQRFLKVRGKTVKLLDAPTVEELMAQVNLIKVLLRQQATKVYLKDDLQPQYCFRVSSQSGVLADLQLQVSSQSVSGE